MGRDLRRRKTNRIRASSGSIYFGLASLVVVVCAVLPLVQLALDLIRADSNSLEVLSNPRLWHLFLVSLTSAAGVTAGTLVLGVPLGLIFARARLPFRLPLFGLHLLSMFLPPFLLALGWFHLFGRQGYIGSEATAQLFFSRPGALVVLALTFTPIITALTALGVRAVDPSLEEAARIVARPLHVAVRILLPAAWPAVLLGALIVFALSFSELGVPMFLRIDSYPAAVFARLGGFDYSPGEAAALVLPMAAVALALVAIERRFVGRRVFAVLGLRRTPPAPYSLGRGAVPVILLAALAASASVLPILAMALRALRGNGFVVMWDYVGSSPGNSLIVAAVSATVVVVLAAVLGHAYARRKPMAALTDGVMVLSFFLPSAVLGVGLIATWNRESTFFVYSSLAILVVGFVARYSIVGVRVFAASVIQSPASFEEAAMAGGVHYLRRLVGIVVPVNWRALAAAWLLTLVFCLRDVETAVLFYPPGGEPLTVRIFTLEANGPESLVAALALLHVAITALALGIGSGLIQTKSFSKVGKLVRGGDGCPDRNR